MKIAHSGGGGPVRIS